MHGLTHAYGGIRPEEEEKAHRVEGGGWVGNGGTAAKRKQLLQ